MKISELIEKLQAVQNECGDLDVWLEVDYFGEYNCEAIGPLKADPEVINLPNGGTGYAVQLLAQEW